VCVESAGARDIEEQVFVKESELPNGQRLTGWLALSLIGAVFLMSVFVYYILAWGKDGSLTLLAFSFFRSFLLEFSFFFFFSFTVTFCTFAV